MSIKRLPLLVLLVILSLSLAGCAGLSSPKQTATPEQQFTLEENTVSASGEVVPAHYGNLGFINGGKNVQFYVSIGELVKKDQLMASVTIEGLEATEAQALANVSRAELALESLEKQPSEEILASARANLASAEANYDRLERADANQIELDAALAQIDATKAALQALEAGPSNAELELARVDLLAAEANLEQAKAATQSAYIFAPFDGEVIELYAQPFENVSPGQLVVLLADLSTLQVETTDLNEVDAARIQVGDRVEVTFDALPNVLADGTISRIASKTASGSAVNYTTIITIDDLPPGLRWGMTAFVIIPID